MKVMTTWNGKRLFTSVGASGYPVKMDATPAYGGDGKGATPMELVLAGLAGCIGIDVTMILDQFLGSIRSIEIEADGTRKETTPTGFTAIELIFAWTATSRIIGYGRRSRWGKKSIARYRIP